MGELVVILIVALLVLGPKRLPEVASGLGKAIRDFRRATQDLQGQLDVDESVSKPFRDLKAALRDEPQPFPRVAPASPAPIPTIAASTVPFDPGTTAHAPDPLHAAHADQPLPVALHQTTESAPVSTAAPAPGLVSGSTLASFGTTPKA